MNIVRVAVVGGGVSGLAAAHRLRTLLGPAAEVVVLEQRDRLGGVLRTVDLAGVPYDVGAEAFLWRRPEARALLDELAARDEIRSFWHQTNRLELQIASAVLAHTQALDQPLDALGEALETLDAALVRWPSPSQLDSLLSRLRLVRELALALDSGRNGYAGPYQDLQRLLPVLADEALSRLVPRGALRG